MGVTRKIEKLLAERKLALAMVNNDEMRFYINEQFAAVLTALIEKKKEAKDKKAYIVINPQNGTMHGCFSSKRKAVNYSANSNYLIRKIKID